MLVEQIQDLRNWNDNWRMAVYQSLHDDSWEVLLNRRNPDLEADAKANNPKRAFRDAMKMAKALQDKYDESLKKSS